MLGEHIAEQLQAASKLPVEDPVWAMRLRQWSSLIQDVAAEVSGGELIFHLAHPRDVGIAKEVADHRIGESAAHEIVDHQTHCELTTCLLEQTRHDCLLTAPE